MGKDCSPWRSRRRPDPDLDLRLFAAMPHLTRGPSDPASPARRRRPLQTAPRKEQPTCQSTAQVIQVVTSGRVGDRRWQCRKSGGEFGRPPGGRVVVVCSWSSSSTPRHASSSNRFTSSFRPERLGLRDGRSRAAPGTLDAIHQAAIGMPWAVRDDDLRRIVPVQPVHLAQQRCRPTTTGCPDARGRSELGTRQRVDLHPRSSPQSSGG